MWGELDFLVWRIKEQLNFEVLKVCANQEWDT